MQRASSPRPGTASASSPGERGPARATPFDWNRGGATAEGLPQRGVGAATGDTPGGERRPPFGRATGPVAIVDETLRDGLQCVSCVNPPIAQKIELLHAMARIGVDIVSVALPAAGPGQLEDAYLLCREIASAGLPLAPTAAARAVVADVEQIARAAARAGAPIEVYSFIASSPIRHLVEGWDTDFLTRSVAAAAGAAAAAGLPFCLVAEDATRSRPEVLRALLRAAVDGGARRVCLCDTTGHATPYGTAALIAFTRRELAALGAAGVALDWHAHNDRGLGLVTALWAVSSGVERVHGTALGVGERVGNTPLELLVENLGLLGARPAAPRARLLEYCAIASRVLAWPIPQDHPLAGDRFARERRGDRPYRVVRPDAADAGFFGAVAALDS